MRDEEMSDINFKLTLQLATPFYSAIPLTLDGLLSAAVHHATGLMGEDTIPLIPLAMEHGVFKGSSLFCCRSYRHAAVGRIMSLRTEKDLSVELFKPNARGGRYAHVDQQRGDYKANMSAYPGIDAREVYFWGVGDPDKAAQMISDFIPGIGKRATAGAGQITDVSWIETDEDCSWMLPSGLPARPLPIAIWNQLEGRSDQSVSTMPLAVRLPYWQTEAEKAVFPVSLTA